MKKIATNNGDEILVDDEDYDKLSKFKWYLGKAAPYPKRVEVTLMHREIMNAKKGDIVDHINGNPLDNRKSNLRFVTKSQNAVNSNKKPGISGYRGVKKNGKNGWAATIMIDRKGIHLGTYKTQEEAARAYDAKAEELFGEFRRQNS